MPFQKSRCKYGKKTGVFSRLVGIHGLIAVGVTAGVTLPIVAQGAGDQEIAAVVLGRDEMSPLATLKVTALSAASPWILSDVAPELISST